MQVRLENPAVVLNPGTAGVGIIHALALGGVDVVTVGRRWPPLLGRFSRIPKRRFTYEPQRESLVDCLLRVALHFGGRAVLYPAIDVDLEPLLEEQQRLSARYHVPAAPQVGTRILAKSWQYELALRIGVPIPRHASFLGGTRPRIDGFRFPLIVKPSVRTEAGAGKTFRLRVVDDTAALDALLAEVAQGPAEREFQIAENIPGEPSELYTVGTYSDRSGRVIAVYTGRKRSQRPYSHGDASIAESVAVPEVVVRQAKALLEEARFHGISQVEFKHDTRDGLYKLMEINGRSWSWIKLAAYSGVNLPLVQYYDLTGDPRLHDAVSAAQADAYFFVREALVQLNNLPIERQLIRDLASRKTLVSAVGDPRDRRLSLLYRLATLVRPGGLG